MVKAKESTSTELTVVTPEEQAYIDSIRGEKREHAGPNKLVINESGTDEDGNKRPIGAWHIRGTDVYHDGEIMFRPVRMANKLLRYTSENDIWKVVAQSIFFESYKAEIIDSTGGVNLGRTFGKKFSDEERKEQQTLGHAYMCVWGLVKIPGDDTEYPVEYRVRGSKIVTIGNALRAVPKDKLYSQFNFKLNTFQPKGTKYWDIKIEPDMSKVLPVTSIIAYDKAIVEYIQEANSEVMRDHKKARGEAVGQVLASDAKGRLLEAEILPPVDDEELPF